MIAAGWSVGFEDEDPDEWDEWSDNKFIPMCFYHCAPDGNDKVLFLSLLPNSANDLRMDKEVDELREEHCSRGLDSGYTNLVYGIF